MVESVIQLCSRAVREIALCGEKRQWMMVYGDQGDGRRRLMDNERGGSEWTRKTKNKKRTGKVR